MNFLYHVVSYFIIVDILYATDVVPPEILVRLNCALGIQRDNNCPVDGGWSAWGPWEACRGECGQPGYRLRHRYCNNPVPSKGGAPCSGEDMQSEPCNLHGCSAAEYQKLLLGDPLREGQFNILKVIHETYPTLEERCVVGVCTFHTVQSVLNDKALQYWNALHCVKHNIGCPAFGGWTPWSSWSSCTAICGKGKKYRLRSCTNPIPSLPELNCKEESYQEKACTGTACAKKLDGIWTSWSPWSECSQTCGLGLKKRHRDCTRKVTREMLSKMGIEDYDMLDATTRDVREIKTSSICNGPREEIAQCENKACSVDGAWSPWEAWSPCSAACGIGAQSRSRACSNPPPIGGGKICQGAVTEVQKCFIRPCGVKTHQVATFSGDGSLLYLPTGRPSRMLILYLRFMTLSSYGILIHRYHESCIGQACDYVRLAIEGSFLVLIAQLDGCVGSVITSNKIQLDQWHDVLMTVTGISVTLRLDDSSIRLSGLFTCIPKLPKLDQAMRVGERFRGHIQRLAINFSSVRLHKPLTQSKSHHTGSAPFTSANVGYEEADQEESYRTLQSNEVLEIPCPLSADSWKVELAVHLADSVDGSLLYVDGDQDEYLLLHLQTGQVLLRCLHGSVGSPERLDTGQWMLIQLSYNSEEPPLVSMSVNGGEAVTITGSVLCKSQILIGQLPQEIQKKLKGLSESKVPEIPQNALSCTLGFIKVDGNLIELVSAPAQTDSKNQLSSWAASTADLYEEHPILMDQPVNLTCVFDKANEGWKAFWLQLDIPILSEKQSTVREDMIPFHVQTRKHLISLSATAYTRESVETFYSCWVGHHIMLSFGITIVDPNIDLNSYSVTSLEILATLSALLCAAYFTIMCTLAMKESDEKFGLYQNIKRFFKGEKLSKEEEVECMLQLINSPKGRTILGSEEAVAQCAAKLVRNSLFSDAKHGQYDESGETSHDVSSFSELPSATERETKMFKKDRTIEKKGNSWHGR